MAKMLALVLGGGGARGALQVGAMRALCERGYQPDLVIGTSAGAINAAYVALHGFSAEGIDSLAATWDLAGETELLPANYIRETLRAMLRANPASPASRLRDFFVANGMTPELTFAGLDHPRLIIVSSDLNTGKPVLHGLAEDDSVLEALLASTALPPWVMPRKSRGHELMDGAVVSSLPIEPALQAGATDIVALDLMDARDPFGEARGFGILVNKMAYAVEQRQVDLELKLAEARGVPVLYMDLTAEQPVAIWDFQHTEELVERGYQQASAVLDLHDASAEGSLPAAA
jgi:NTE family protein